MLSFNASKALSGLNSFSDQYFISYSCHFPCHLLSSRILLRQLEDQKHRVVSIISSVTRQSLLCRGKKSLSYSWMYLYQSNLYFFQLTTSFSLSSFTHQYVNDVCTGRLRQPVLDLLLLQFRCQRLPTLNLLRRFEHFNHVLFVITQYFNLVCPVVGDMLCCMWPSIWPKP